MLKIKLRTLAQRHGLSLVEVMVAMVMTLIVLGAMMAAFSYGSAEMQKGRASIELNNRLITAEEQLRRDLDRITVEVKPHQDLRANPRGFVEFVDGPERDYNSGNEIPSLPYHHGGNELIFGDRDDFFGCTIKSNGKALRGRRTYGAFNDVVESHFAEVAWFCIDTPGVAGLPATTTNSASASTQMVCRRQLLILPALGTLLPAPSEAAVLEFFAENDISARLDPVTGDLVANSLDDLAVRENRYCHHEPAVGGSFTARANPALSNLRSGILPASSSSDHIMFSSVAAFDIQVFDLDASVNVVPDSAGTGILDIAVPSDIGPAKTGIGVTAAISGAYVDLGKNLAATGFIGPMRSSANCNYAGAGQAVYDTGTSEYNRNESNDQGANGINNGGSSAVVDDWQEKDSIAPYNAPLRGIKFTMRVIEPNTKQVRQLTVKKSFTTQ